jgi:hypothetical protein
MRNPSIEASRGVEPGKGSPISTARAGADVSRRLLGDALVSGNRALLLGWVRLELDRQLAELEPTRDEDEVPF